jgi:hypothetical protein
MGVESRIARFARSAICCATMARPPPDVARLSSGLLYFRRAAPALSISKHYNARHQFNGPEISTSMNLLSKHDIIIGPERTIHNTNDAGFYDDKSTSESSGAYAEERYLCIS